MKAKPSSVYDVESIGRIPLSQLQSMGLTPKVKNFEVMEIGETQKATKYNALNGHHVNTEKNTVWIERLD